MGVTVVGLDALIDDLEHFQTKGPEKWRKVLSRGGVQIKLAWRKRWSPIGAPPHQAWHLKYGIGYDAHERGNTRFWVVVGVASHNPQAPLAHFAEYGLLTQAPLPGGLPSLLEEEPRFVQAVADVAVELLEGR